MPRCENHETKTVLEKEKALKEINETREAYRKGGAKGYWQKQLEFVGAYGNDHYYEAMLHANLGENDKALRALEIAWEKDESIENLNVEPVFDSIRDDPRYKDLLRRLNLLDQVEAVR